MFDGMYMVNNVGIGRECNDRDMRHLDELKVNVEKRLDSIEQKLERLEAEDVELLFMFALFNK